VTQAKAREILEVKAGFPLSLGRESLPDPLTIRYVGVRDRILAPASVFPFPAHPSEPQDSRRPAAAFSGLPDQGHHLALQLRRELRVVAQSKSVFRSRFSAVISAITFFRETVTLSECRRVSLALKRYRMNCSVKSNARSPYTGLATCHNQDTSARAEVAPRPK